MYFLTFTQTLVCLVKSVYSVYSDVLIIYVHCVYTYILYTNYYISIYTFDYIRIIYVQYILHIQYNLPPPKAFQKNKIGGKRYSYATLRYSLQPRKHSSQISNFNLRTGILITGCMACGGGSSIIVYTQYTLCTL